MKKNVISRMSAGAVAMAALLVTAAGTAQADPRSYVWTYEYMTVHEGKAEIEYYSTVEVADTDNKKASVWKQNVELEYGLAERTDLALYQNFKQTNTAATKSFVNDGMKLRLRHRLKDKGELPLDTLFYAEYKRSTDLSSAGGFEGKLILAKDIGKFNLAYNQVIEFPLEKPSDSAHYFYASASWKAARGFRLGMESKGVYRTGELYLGPTVNLRAPGLKVWANFGWLAGLNPDSKDTQTRMIIGVPF